MAGCDWVWVGVWNGKAHFKDKMKNRLSIKLCRKNILTEKKYDEPEKYSSISYVRDGQNASSLACAAGVEILKSIK